MGSVTTGSGYAHGFHGEGSSGQEDRVSGQGLAWDQGALGQTQGSGPWPWLTWDQGISGWSWLSRACLGMHSAY